MAVSETEKNAFLTTVQNLVIQGQNLSLTEMLSCVERVIRSESTLAKLVLTTFGLAVTLCLKRPDPRFK